jgi:general secretion pathway protein A
MYESYWQLNRKPFDSGCDPAFYYPGESHQAAFLKLRYAIENQRGGALLAGPSGSGKTMLVGMLRGLLAESATPLVHLVFPQMSTEELLAYLASKLGGSDDGPGTPGIRESIERIEQSLVEAADEGRPPVVVIDEAQLLVDRRTLEAIRLLLNFEHAGRPAMTLLLVGQPAILPTLERMPPVEERLGVKCLLRPFTSRETAEYVAHRLCHAGAKQAIFEPEALESLHELTHGIPRRINRLADLALLIGYAEECRTIDAERIESVSQELVVVAPE